MIFPSKKKWEKVYKMLFLFNSVNYILQSFKKKNQLFKFIKIKSMICKIVKDNKNMKL